MQGPVAFFVARGPLRQRGIGAAQRSITKLNVSLATSQHRQWNRNKSVNFNNHDKPSLFVDTVLVVGYILPIDL